MNKKFIKTLSILMVCALSLSGCSLKFGKQKDEEVEPSIDIEDTTPTFTEVFASDKEYEQGAEVSAADLVSVDTTKEVDQIVFMTADGSVSETYNASEPGNIELYVIVQYTDGTAADGTAVINVTEKQSIIPDDFKLLWQRNIRDDNVVKQNITDSMMISAIANKGSTGTGTTEINGETVNSVVFDFSGDDYTASLTFALSSSDQYVLDEVNFLNTALFAIPPLNHLEKNLKVEDLTEEEVNTYTENVQKIVKLFTAGDIEKTEIGNTYLKDQVLTVYKNVIKLNYAYITGENNSKSITYYTVNYGDKVVNITPNYIATFPSFTEEENSSTLVGPYDETVTFSKDDLLDYDKLFDKMKKYINGGTVDINSFVLMFNGDSPDLAIDKFEKSWIDMFILDNCANVIDFVQTDVAIEGSADTTTDASNVTVVKKEKYSSLHSSFYTWPASSTIINKFVSVYNQDNLPFGMILKDGVLWAYYNSENDKDSETSEGSTSDTSTSINERYFRSIDANGKTLVIGNTSNTYKNRYEFTNATSSEVYMKVDDQPVVVKILSANAMNSLITDCIYSTINFDSKEYTITANEPYLGTLAYTTKYILTCKQSGVEKTYDYASIFQYNGVYVTIFFSDGIVHDNKEVLDIVANNLINRGE